MVAAARIGKGRDGDGDVSSRRWSGEVEYDDYRSRSLHQRRCHIRRVAYDHAGRGENCAARTSNEYEATAAMDNMVRRAAADSTP
jgi:hypothetical protein